MTQEATLSFETLQFNLKQNTLQIYLLKIFKLEIPLSEVKKIGKFEFTDKNTISFSNVKEKKARIQFMGLFDKYLPKLVNTISKQQATYIHSGSGIPLIGAVSFGIVYRNSSIIEIKPITSCNLSCVYCSVKEGKNSGKRDIVVEMEYLLEELNKLLEFVSEPVEIHIGVQGEPFLYADMVEMVERLQELEQVHTISTDTNLTIVTKAMVDRMEKCDKFRLNISLDSMDLDNARRIAAAPNYNLPYVLDMIRYIAKSKLNFLIAPVYVPGFNDEELPKIIEFVKTLPASEKRKGEKELPKVCIQNYLPYKSGRRPVKIPATWEKFYLMLDKLELEHDIQLRINADDFEIKSLKELPKPFSVDDEIRAKLVGRDRFDHTCLAAAGNRVISVPNCEFSSGKKVKLKIIRDKHNIFTGKLV
ncbi:hypothetical protein CL619_03720 [archaeon]|nr:hypothetical protein [archaeon]|tara:strand:- start:1091 stop:2344 length:1254 start_codon:yes stop_codon:yes gene_type:complete